MTDLLGHLVWWNVGGVNVPLDGMESLLNRLGITPPKRPAPIDAFRRLTSDARYRYELDDHEVTLDCHNVESPDSILNRHIVRTLTTRDGVNVSIRRVGECSFNRKSNRRIRVVTQAQGLPDADRIEIFAQGLRDGWDVAVNVADAQAIRRLVRGYLTDHHALPLDGPYFMMHEGDVRRLQELLTELGGGCRCRWVPVIDDADRRDMISDAVEAGVESGGVTPELVQAYVEAGLASESVLSRVKELVT